MTLPTDEFPRLTPDNHRVTSPATPDYKCLAWAAKDTEHWWQPGTYCLPADWPEEDYGMGALEHAFLVQGYIDCQMDTSPEPGFSKVALYGSGSATYTHAARQLLDGKWTSKLGKGVDIEHDTPDAVSGALYGEVMQVSKRPNPPA